MKSHLKLFLFRKYEQYFIFILNRNDKRTVDQHWCTFHSYKMKFIILFCNEVIVIGSLYLLTADSPQDNRICMNKYGPKRNCLFLLICIVENGSSSLYLALVRIEMWQWRAARQRAEAVAWAARGPQHANSRGARHGAARPRYPPVPERWLERYCRIGNRNFHNYLGQNRIVFYI